MMCLTCCTTLVPQEYFIKYYETCMPLMTSILTHASGGCPAPCAVPLAAGWLYCLAGHAVCGGRPDPGLPRRIHKTQLPELRARMACT